MIGWWGINEFDYSLSIPHHLKTTGPFTQVPELHNRFPRQLVVHQASSSGQ